MFRATFFCADSQALTDEDWRIVTGESEAALRQNVPGGRRLAGEALGGELSGTATGGRIDWVLSPLVRNLDAPPEGGFLLLGVWAQVCDAFLSLVEKWVGATQSPIVRVALGTVAIAPTKTKLEGYSLLDSLLPSVEVNGELSRDFLYRINWPRPSNVLEGNSINRITTWGAIQSAGIVLQVGEAGFQTVAQNVAHHAIRLELDHNTDASNAQPFQRAAIIPTLMELAELARENLAVGECP